jgi:hypothetical protein
MSVVVGAKAPQTLDELMLAMDVVDTIRHRELVVARELAQGDRDEALKARLREIYRGQGLEVSDAAIEQGIKALKESRFVYTPPAPSIGRSLAMAWVRRRIIGRWAGGIAAVCAALWAAGYFGYELPRRQALEEVQVALTQDLPQELRAAAGAARVETRDAAILGSIDGLERDGNAALARRDIDGVRASIASLEGLRSRLVSTYVVSVLSGANETSGVWRESAASPGARNYYLIVEAVLPDGQRQPLTVVNEENGQSSTVTRWGLRVPEAFFDQIRQDKQDNGIIEKNPIGQMLRGEIEPRYNFPKEGGAITSWDE